MGHTFYYILKYFAAYRSKEALKILENWIVWLQIWEKKVIIKKINIQRASKPKGNNTPVAESTHILVLIQVSNKRNPNP